MKKELKWRIILYDLLLGIALGVIWYYFNSRIFTAIILGFCFMGISVLADRLNLYDEKN